MPRCEAQVKVGRPCSRPALPGRRFCKGCAPNISDADYLAAVEYIMGRGQRSHMATSGCKVAA